jgi:translation initiation factor eIF-2B subunit epsilon
MLVHPPSSRLLHYHLHPLQPSATHVEFPANLFVDPFPASIDTYEIWAGTSAAAPGYRDLGVDICEADVPALCTENFDYHDLRRHFVNGVLTSELLGKKIAVHLVGSEGEGEREKDRKDGRSGAGGGYVERVRDTRTYSDIRSVFGLLFGGRIADAQPRCYAKMGVPAHTRLDGSRR